ncbi:AAA family ATPase [Subtercola frigoramans]|uniref:Chromosome partitioning protein n=1 Tax=Subtercola frigoramans TaxID=120298 RepID=A0ABS2L0G5_9MICO|nr:AAA family ATPase [Subtercola frigoramans]MBM7470544.1 chromosome partitioning protein [Subtercola frigoramans]
MIILVGSEKGGPGKTTVAINLSAEFARLGRDVVLVDADAQRSAARWHADREEARITPVIASVEKLGNVRDTLLDLDHRYDIVVVDVAGKDSKEMRTGMTAAHKMIVTVRPSQLDLDTLPHMKDLVDQARDFNPNLDVRALLTQVPTNANGTEHEDAADYLADYPELNPMRTVIHERKAYRDVVGEGRGVVEWNNPKARAEIQELAGELMAK